jgi:hypothetical protein
MLLSIQLGADASATLMLLRRIILEIVVLVIVVLAIELKSAGILIS